jgi:hypothetical protein
MTLASQFDDKPRAISSLVLSQEPVAARLNEPVMAGPKEPVTIRLNEPVTARLKTPVTARLKEPVTARLKEPVTAQLKNPVMARRQSGPSDPHAAVRAISATAGHNDTSYTFWPGSL